MTTRSPARANGNGNDASGAPIFVPATLVSPDPSLSAVYPDYPQEFRFVYTNVPSSGTATLSVRLKEYATSVLTNRYTMLTATVNTLAPTQVVKIVSPATNGTVLNYASNLTYQVQAYFSPTLTTSTSNFNVLINGLLQPQSAYILRPTNSTSSNMKILYYNWNNPPPGTNLIQVIYTNAIVPIEDQRSVIVAPPLVISSPGQQPPTAHVEQHSRRELSGVDHHQLGPAVSTGEHPSQPGHDHLLLRRESRVAEVLRT